MGKKILIVNICKEKLHYFEFIKPVLDIIKNYTKAFVRHYKNLKKQDLGKADKIIICSTSLRDNAYLNDVEIFDWVKTCNKPILGICGGMQIIGLIFKSELRKKTEIGFYEENFKKEFFGLKGKQKVYHLHNYYVTLPKNFEKFTNSKIPQAIKHKTKKIYGVLFHPEVRQKDLIKKFILS